MDRLLNLRELLRDFALRPEPVVTENVIPDLTGRVYLVTGASSGIGCYAARYLAHAGATVYLTGRTESKLAMALEQIRAESPQSTVHGLIVAYDDLSSIKRGLETLLKAPRLDGVIHNAGMNYNGPTPTEYGYDLAIVVNDLGPQIVQTLIDPLLRRTAATSPADSVRVVWVSSSAHFLAPPVGGIDWDNINNDKLGGKGYGFYGQTKAINIYQAKLWGQKYADAGIVSVALHPGIITSDIRRNAPGKRSPYELFCRPTKYGAYAELHVLLQPDVTAAHNGSYYVPFGQRARIRPDIEQAARGPRGVKTWRWLTETVAAYT